MEVIFKEISLKITSIYHFFYNLYRIASSNDISYDLKMAQNRGRNMSSV